MFETTNQSWSLHLLHISISVAWGPYENRLCIPVFDGIITQGHPSSPPIFLGMVGFYIPPSNKKNGDDWGMVQMTFYIFYDIVLPTLIRILDLKILFRSKGQPQSLLSEPRSQGQVLEQNPTPWAGRGFIDVSGLLLLRWSFWDISHFWYVIYYTNMASIINWNIKHRHRYLW